MKKDKLILVVLLVILLGVGSAMLYTTFHKEEVVEVLKSDALKFKEEYEKLNNEVSENGIAYPIVNINEDNAFVYKNEEEIVDLLENGTGVIYFGFAKCPYCRSILPILNEVILEEEIMEVNYLDIESIRDVYELDGNEKCVLVEDGTKSYKKMVNILSDYLDDYILSGFTDKPIKTGVKRIFAPTIVAVNKGKILGVYTRTINSQKSGFNELSEEEKKSLKKELKELVKNLPHSNTCTKEAC